MAHDMSINILGMRVASAGDEIGSGARNGFYNTTGNPNLSILENQWLSVLIR